MIYPKKSINTIQQIYKFHYNIKLKISLISFQKMQNEQQEMQQTMKNLIKGKSDVILFGLKSSGKTTLATKILDDALGKNNYVKLNMLILDRPSQLMRELGYQILYLLKRLDSSIMLQYDNVPIRSEIQNKYSTIQDWLKFYNNFMTKYEQSFKKLPFIYIFMDNIQAYNFDMQFIATFHKAIKTKLKYMKASFFYCGLTYDNLLFACNHPFRSLPFFVMKSLNLLKIINETVSQTQFGKKTKLLRQQITQYQHEDKNIKQYQNKSFQMKRKKEYKIQLDKVQQFEKLVRRMKSMMYNSLDSVYRNIQQIKLITICFVDYIDQFVNNDGDRARQWRQKHRNQEQKLLKKLIINGPIVLTRLKGQSQLGSDDLQELQQIPPTLENYPNLILTSLNLANKFREKYDAQMYLFSKKKISENKISENRLTSRLNYDPTNKPHTDRVRSIAQIIQQQAKENILTQKNQKYHSLDYYGCFQYLREEGFVNIFPGKLGGRMSANKMKQEQVDKFVERTKVIHKSFLQ